LIKKKTFKLKSVRTYEENIFNNFTKNLIRESNLVFLKKVNNISIRMKKMSFMIPIMIGILQI